MTTPSVVLCMDEETERYPEGVGLAGENFAAQPWLKVVPCGEQARSYVAEAEGVDEVWVVSCDDVAPINLAASLKRDRPSCFVGLLTAQGSGSLMSRTSATGIDATLSPQAFVQRYLARKGDERARVEAAGQTIPVPEAAPAVPTPQAFVLTFAGGGGGTGRSALSVLMAFLSQKMGHRTLLLDCDLQFGDVAELAGVVDPLRMPDALANPALLSALRCEGARPAVLAAPLHIDEAEAVAEHIPSLVERLSGCFDVIIVNTGSAWAECNAWLAERSAKTVFVVAQRPSSLRACQRALDLCARCGIAASPFTFVLNRCTKGAPLTTLDVSCALGGAAVAEVADGGSDVEELLAAGLPLELLSADNPAAESLVRLGRELLPRREGDEGSGADTAPKRRFWGWHRRRNRKGDAPCL